METLTLLIVVASILLASMVAVELGISVAIVEILLGVFGGNYLGIESVSWLEILAGLGAMVLVFLAGTEIDLPSLKGRWKQTAILGSSSFVLPLIGMTALLSTVIGWQLEAALLGGIVLSTASVAITFTVLTESGLLNHPIGKSLIAATFLTDLLAVIALFLIFIEVTPYFIIFVLGSIAIVALAPILAGKFFRRYGNRVVEPEIKAVIFMLVLLMILGEMGAAQAVLPAFLLGIALSGHYFHHRLEKDRLRVVAFAFLTPFFFFKGGLNISLNALSSSVGIIAALFFAKFVFKTVAVYPLAHRFMERDAVYSTLILTAGLTFGIIGAVFGAEAGIIDGSQFSILMGVVLLTAIVPAIVAQRFFSPQAVDKH